MERNLESLLLVFFFFSLAVVVALGAYTAFETFPAADVLSLPPRAGAGELGCQPTAHLALGAAAFGGIKSSPHDQRHSPEAGGSAGVRSQVPVLSLLLLLGFWAA